MFKRIIKIMAVFFSAVLLLGVVFVFSLLPAGERDLDALKNIHGIPFYNNNQIIHVTEELAHVNLKLIEPSFAKTLQLTVTFDPKDVQSISVGPRKTPFWLSYDWQTIYDDSYDEGANKQITKKLAIPLTDVLQRPDRSVDLMFKTQSTENISWELHSLKAEVIWQMPTRWEVREYFNRVKTKERPL